MSEHELITLAQALEQKDSVDLDRICVKLLLIVKSKSQFSSVAQFLTRRGWSVSVCSQMNEAISIISKEPPDFVMISFNHPNPNLLRMPQLLSQSFNSVCVGFCEASDLRTESKLTAAKIQHKLLGAASGPSIHRKIKQIMGDMFGQSEEGGQAKSLNKVGNQAGDSSTKVFSGTARETDENGVMVFSNNKQKVPGNASDLMKRLQAELVDEASEKELAEIEGKESKLAQESAKSRSGKGDEISLDKLEENDLDLTQEDEPTDSAAIVQSGIKSKNKIAIQKGVAPDGRVVDEQGAKLETAASQKNGGLSLAEQMDANAKDKEQKKKTGVMQSGAVKEVDQKKKLGKTLQKDVGVKKEKLTATKVKKEDDSLFLVCETAMQRLKFSTEQKYDRVFYAGVMIPVNSEKHKGFLLLTTKNIRFDKLPMEHQLHEKLAEVAKENKVTFQFGAAISIEIEIEEVDQWVREKSLFLSAKPLGDGEVWLSFFEKEIHFGEELVANQDNKMTVTAQSLNPEVKLNFDVFLFLKKSNKYLRYLKREGNVGEAQKSKLEKKQVELFINSRDHENFSKYLAENYVIEEVGKKIAEKKKAS